MFNTFFGCPLLSLHREISSLLRFFVKDFEIYLATVQRMPVELPRADLDWMQAPLATVLAYGQGHRPSC